MEPGWRPVDVVEDEGRALHQPRRRPPAQRRARARRRSCRPRAARPGRSGRPVASRVDSRAATASVAATEVVVSRRPSPLTAGGSAGSRPPGAGPAAPPWRSRRRQPRPRGQPADHAQRLEPGGPGRRAAPRADRPPPRRPARSPLRHPAPLRATPHPAGRGRRGSVGRLSSQISAAHPEASVIRPRSTIRPSLRSPAHSTPSSSEGPTLREPGPGTGAGAPASAPRPLRRPPTPRGADGGRPRPPRGCR